MTDRERWLMDRRDCVTSTDMPKLLGLSPWGTALHVYRDKVADRFTDRMPTPEQQAGLLLEPLVARLYQEQTGKEAQPVDAYRLHRNKSCQFLACSLDRLAPNNGLVELKTLNSWDGWGADGTDEVRVDYLAQVQTQLLVTGREYCDVAAMHRGTLETRVYTVKPNPALLGMILNEAVEFWRRHVEPRRPPEPDYRHPLTLDLLKAMRPTPGLEVDLDAGAGVFADQWTLLGNLGREQERMRNEAKARLLGALGEAERGRLPDGRLVRRLTVEVPAGMRRASTQTRILIEKGKQQ